MILGVWHSYKYVLSQFYIGFLPLLTCIEHGMMFTADPEGLTIPNKLKVVVMEKVVMGIFLRCKELKEAVGARITALNVKRHGHMLTKISHQP